MYTFLYMCILLIQIKCKLYIITIYVSIYICDLYIKNAYIYTYIKKIVHIAFVSLVI